MPSLDGWVVLAGLALLLAGGAALWLGLRLHRERGEARLDDLKEHLKHLEALQSLLQVVKLRSPLPPMGGYSIQPDFANHLVAILREERPRACVETGSGVSTILVGYVLESLGEGKLVALEHHERYAERTARDVKRHGLQRFVHVAHAPLRDVTLAGEPWLFYDLNALRGLAQIDFLLVDGPADETTRPGGRYPALPLLLPQLGERATVILHFVPESQRAMVDRWMKEHPEFEREDLPVTKGAVVLRRRRR
jgi:predicted O-methyltransferase YrrM